MPSIDYDGAYCVHAESTARDSRAAIRFPVKASSSKVAKRFAEKMVLAMLPGWTVGAVSLMKHKVVVWSWLLTRKEERRG